MKIEKLTENKIRIIINLEELNNNNINLNDFMMNNLESQKFFLDILNKAEKEVGFTTNDCKLLIEAFTSLDEIFVFTITKFSKPKKAKPSLKLKSNKKNKLLKNQIYQFSSFEDFCNLCQVLDKSNISLNYIAKKISLYLYNNTYYLVFWDLNLAYKNLVKLFSILSEYATAIIKSEHFEAKLIEYGKPIIKQNAFKIGIKYFVKTTRD